MKHRLKELSVALGLAGMLWLGGCASTSQNNDAQLKELQKQVMQLKAENTNLQAKTRQLDDQVMLYEKRKSLSEKKKSDTGMQTVRLMAPGASYVENGYSDEESTVSFRDTFEEESDESDEDSRPVLHLNESSLTRYDEANVPMATRPAALPTSSYENIPATNRGDNLGVVTADGQLAQAEADAMDLFNASYRAYNNGDYAAALAGFTQFLQKESNHKYADNAMFWIAECHLAKGDLLRAVGEFERLLRRYPGSEKSASSLYRIGFIYDRMNDAAKAKEYYFRVVEQYPNSEAARKASRRMSNSKGNARLVRTSAQR
ncbi:MAG: tol-pal system protein YbgF [Deltaproteobacteria bacterium]|nr:tol-pal system protein YbgF [Deltaproteobacteria bacterium]MBN2673149.1 tol-pal system protein YbgF [Deltaproteobacteria bacterium]